MDRPTSIAVAALLVALFAALTALFVVFAPGTQTADARLDRARLGLRASEGELLQHMVLFQRYAEKTALAAEADNWELAAFYADKIRDNAVLVVDGGYVIDGVDVSQIAATMALERAEALVAATEAGDPSAYAAAYARMIDGCNTCHKRAGFRYVEIVEPDAARYPSQRFAPLSARPTAPTAPASE